MMSVRMPFGKFKDFHVIALPSSYLCWIVKTYKGGFRAQHAGQFDKNIEKIPEDVFVAAKKTLDERGYNTKGLVPIKK